MVRNSGIRTQGEQSVRTRLIVTGTAAAFVLTAGIVGAVAVQPPGQEQDRDTSAAPATPDALQGLPPMMLKRAPIASPGEKGTVDVHSNPSLRSDLFTYTPPPASDYKPRHMADPDSSRPASDVTLAPRPGPDFGGGSGTVGPTKPSTRPTPPPAQGPTTPPTQTPAPTPTPEPTPTPTPTPTPEPSDPPTQEPSDPPTPEPTPEPTVEPTEPAPEPSTEPSGPTEPSPEPSPSNSTETA